MIPACDAITAYIAYVRSGEVAVCKEQLLLCDYIERCFAREKLRVDTQQLAQYFGHEKHFPFRLFLWERFCFALHNCVYRADGELRWPLLLIYVGRGAGKNGYLSFEDFCLITPVNGVQEYHIDIFATSEKQARTSFDDVYNVLDANKPYFSRYFTWNQEIITNKKTKSKLFYCTSNPETKDGGRPGKVDFDECHAYKNDKLLNVATTGLGKKRFPRRTIITTDGDVRDGPLDALLAIAMQILHGEIDDNGMLPFLCRLDSDKEVHDPAMWPKANPSLVYFPSLMTEMLQEYATYKQSPLANSAFMTKRMNRPQENSAETVTSWENILAASRDLPDLTGCDCVGGIDYASTQDFVAAGLLFVQEGVHYWLTHTWVCRQSKDLERIKAPLDRWEKQDLLTFVDGPEIPPELPVEWMEAEAAKYNITVTGIDKYRHTLMRKALENAGFDTQKEGRNNVKLIRKSDQMLWAPTIESIFNNHAIAWGKESELMRWYTNNACVLRSKDGNMCYGKIEAKSRKTDGFMALVAAICASAELESRRGALEILSYGVVSC